MNNHHRFMTVSYALFSRYHLCLRCHLCIRTMIIVVSSVI